MYRIFPEQVLCVLHTKKKLHVTFDICLSLRMQRPSLMSAECVYVYNDSSCLVTEYQSNGTLLDLINLRKQVEGTNMDEEWVLHFAIEVIQTVEFMHRCHIIHGDIKPDNFLIANWLVFNSKIFIWESPQYQQQGCESSDFNLISDYFALHKTPFSDLFCIEKLIFSGISDYFRLFQTFSHKCSHTPATSGPSFYLE